MDEIIEIYQHFSSLIPEIILAGSAALKCQSVFEQNRVINDIDFQVPFGANLSFLKTYDGFVEHSSSDLDPVSKKIVEVLRVCKVKYTLKSGKWIWVDFFVDEANVLHDVMIDSFNSVTVKFLHRNEIKKFKEEYVEKLVNNLFREFNNLRCLKTSFLVHSVDKTFLKFDYRNNEKMIINLNKHYLDILLIEKRNDVRYIKEDDIPF